MKEKIAFVCQRYGLEVNGGSELYCRQLSERLSAFYDVTVYTTCAIDYVSWANYYPKGEEEINGIHVKRFAVSEQRNIEIFGQLHGKIMANPFHSLKQEEEWLFKQGPACDELVNQLDKEHDEYKAILLMTYLYYPTVQVGLKNYKNTILIPTLHDEPPVYLKIYDRLFKLVKGIVWNTPEERSFALKRFPFIKQTIEEMCGIGFEHDEDNITILPDEIKDDRYVVYAGRIDYCKGCGEMFDFFLRYKQTHHGSRIKLVLMGKSVMQIPNHQDIINLGFVSESMKFLVMKNSIALLLHSHFESFSMVVLESMMMGRPVLVTGKSDVLKGHCIRSNAGLYFESYEEYEGALDYLLTHQLEYNQMCCNGINYVDTNYKWEKITNKFCDIIKKVSQL